MKVITGIVFMLFSICSFAQQEVFINQIDFKLEHVSEKEYENEYFLTLKLNKGSTYKFDIINHINDMPGEAIFELLDGDKLLITNVVGDKTYDALKFQCNKTGFYDILISFKDNRIGHSTVDIFLIQ